MPLSPFAGTLGPKRAAHLLHRASFGPTKELIENFANLTAAQAVAQLFQQPLPDPVLPIDAKTGKEWFLSGVIENVNSGNLELQDNFKGWFIAQMLSQGIPANQSVAYATREKIVFFMHTVLTTIISKVDDSRAVYFQNQLFRLFAFDKTAGPAFNFKELAKKVSVDNAMLKVLDGYLNVKGGNPQENYSRELHELYTIGRGLEGFTQPGTEPGDYVVYKEADIQAAARVLSGWDLDFAFEKDSLGNFINIDPDTLLPRGKVKGSKTNATAHDNSVKTFSDRFGNKTIQPDPLLLNGGNATESSALDEISQLIEQIYAQPETARNICRRIYRFYVYHSIDQALDDSIIQEMAATFTANGFKLQPVLEDLFQSQHFYDAAAGVNDDNFGGIIKSPLDLMVGTLRFFNVPLRDYTTQPEEFYEQTVGIIRALGLMGMPFYDPFDVAGYDAYHQYPIYHRSWISTNYLAERYNFISELVMGSTSPNGLQVDVVNFVKTNFSNAIASDARSLIIELAKYLFPVHENLTYTAGADTNSGLTAARMNYFLTAFLGMIDANPETAWTTRWNTNSDPETIEMQLKNLLNAMMQSPEYQLY
ncbi:MAG: DUF1800 family protein [Cyclobacteriaceae bacterium]|jgi:uncharacterized protein (DUF1800 family)|nr:DUF1800 domain-containing protein [Flammeovirgaceae bacterium]